jgi:polar amino acid transport system substrate-binding protein
MSEENSAPSWFQNPKNYRWIIPLVALGLLFFFSRSCFGGKTRGEVFVIARDTTWYPLSFYGKEANVGGFSDDLLFHISKLKNISLRLVTSNPGHIMEMLDDDKDYLDGVLFSLRPDSRLKSRYFFSERYYDLGAVLVVRSDSPVTSFAEMSGKYVGVKRGSNVLFDIADRPNITVVSYDSVILMLDDILRDKIDGALMNQLNAFNTTNSYYVGKLKIATPPLTEDGLRLITLNRPREAKLIKAFNEGLQELKENGTYDALLKKWDLPKP